MKTMQEITYQSIDKTQKETFEVEGGYNDAVQYIKATIEAHGNTFQDASAGISKANEFMIFAEVEGAHNVTGHYWTIKT